MKGEDSYQQMVISLFQNPGLIYSSILKKGDCNYEKPDPSNAWW